MPDSFDDARQADLYFIPYPPIERLATIGGGFTFPLGVYAVATLTLARQTHLGFILVAGAVLVVLLAMLWSIIAYRTLRGAWRRTLFVAPCLLSGAIPADFEAQAEWALPFGGPTKALTKVG